MDCFMFMGTAFKRLTIGVLLDVKGIFTAQLVSYTICTLQHLGYIGNAP